MGTVIPPRRLVLDVIRRAAGSLRALRAPADDRAAARALRAACDTVGISPQELDAALASDLELELLRDTAIREALAGSTDPGPHGAISRESMSGKPGDTTKSRSHH